EILSLAMGGGRGDQPANPALLCPRNGLGLIRKQISRRHLCEDFPCSFWCAWRPCSLSAKQNLPCNRAIKAVLTLGHPCSAFTGLSVFFPPTATETPPTRTLSGEGAGSYPHEARNPLFWGPPCRTGT